MKLGPSPYRLHETLRWPANLLRPSTKRSPGVVARAARHRFTPPQPDPIRIVFVGDLMCMRGDRVPRIHGDLRRLIGSADFLVGNCEAPVTRQRVRSDASFWFTFEMAEDYLVAFLDRLGATPDRCALSLANNHIADQGADGVFATGERLTRLGIVPIGLRDRDEPATPVSVGGVTIGLTAWTHWLNRPVHRAVWRADEISEIPSSAWRETRGRLGVDCMIATPHWDYEFRHSPALETRGFARAIAEQGFDLLVGHHPHVCQPVEWLGGMPCVYSIGNLNGPTALLVSRASRLLGVLEIEVGSAGPLRGRVLAYQLHPYVQVGRRSKVRLIPLDHSPAGLQKSLRRRLDLIYPPPTAAGSPEE